MKVCRTCNGNKTISGMGHMKEKCSNCDGKGFVSDVVPKKAEPIKVKPSTVKKPKGIENGEKESRAETA